jgi:hypothetical protein
MGMVEEDGGAYGFVLLTNTSIMSKWDTPWVFATQNNIQDLISGEAYRMFQSSQTQ